MSLYSAVRTKLKYRGDEEVEGPDATSWAN